MLNWGANACRPANVFDIVVGAAFDLTLSGRSKHRALSGGLLKEERVGFEQCGSLSTAAAPLEKY